MQAVGKKSSGGTKVFLALLLLSAFFIRLWGLQFERGIDLYNNDAGSLYLRWAEYFFQGNLVSTKVTTHYHNICYPFFAQFLMAVAYWIYAGLKYLGAALGSVTMIRPFPYEGTLSFSEQVVVGRLLQITLSTAVVYIIYKLGENLLGRRVALIGALFAAFMPQLINHARYLQSDVTVTFFVALCVLFSSYLLTRGRPIWYALAGLAAGLAVGSKHNGAAVLSAVFIAYALRVWERRRCGRHRREHLKFLLALAAFGLGVAVSYPVIWADFPSFRWAFPVFWKMQLVSDKPYTVVKGFWHHRWLNLYRFIADGISQKFGVGPFIFILGIGGALRALASRRVKQLYLISFPLLYFSFIIVFRGNVRHKDFLPGTVFIPLLAASFLVWVVSLLRAKDRLLAAVAWGAALLIAAPSILSDVQVAYCCWEKDTHELSGDWFWEEIPPGSRVVRERYCPHISKKTYDLVGKPDYLWYNPLELYLEHPVDYLVSSTVGHGRFLSPYDTYYNQGAVAYYDELDRRFWKKTFRIDNTGFVDSVIKVYNLNREGPDWVSKAMILRDLEFDYSMGCPEIITLEENLAYEGKSGFRVGEPRRLRKLLIAPEKLSRLGVLVYPGRSHSRIKIRVGGKKKVLDFDDAEPKLAIFHPRINFPFLKYSYGVAATASRGDHFLVKLLTSPREIARAYLRLGPDDRGSAYLEARERCSPLLNALCRAEDFDGRFRELFAEPAPWWREKLARSFEAEKYWNRTGQAQRDQAASGEEALVYRPSDHTPGYLLFGPYAHLPPGPWVVHFRLKIEKSGGEETVAEIDVWNGKRVLARRAIGEADFPASGRYHEFLLPFTDNTFADPLEFRVHTGGGTPLWCDRVDVFPDLKAWFEGYRAEIRE